MTAECRAVIGADGAAGGRRAGDRPGAGVPVGLQAALHAGAAVAAGASHPPRGLLGIPDPQGQCPPPLVGQTRHTS